MNELLDRSSCSCDGRGKCGSGMRGGLGGSVGVVGESEEVVGAQELKQNMLFECSMTADYGEWKSCNG
jgi:hypothetical protein